MDFKALTVQFNDILSKRKKRKLKSKKEIFNFMSKYNELIEEGLLKVCRGRFEIFYRDNDESGRRYNDSDELCAFFSMYSKSALHLIVDILENKQNYLKPGAVGSNMPTIREYLIKALDGINSAIQMQRNNEQHHLAKVGGTGLGSDSLEELLPPVEAPFLPPLDTSRYKYTLVLDLDETLVHYFQTETEGKCLIRPNAEAFLQEMSKYYEIVIFTAAMQDYADWVIDQIDPEGYIKYRLYRQHALP